MYKSDNPVMIKLDDDDYEKYCGFKWHIDRYGYARRTVYIKEPNGVVKFKNVALHREILGISNMPRSVICDHINGDRSDNRKTNLRIVNAMQNAANRHAVISSTGVLGATSHGDKYVARARINGTLFYLGLFDSPEDAGKAYRNFKETKTKKTVSTKYKSVVQYNSYGEILNEYKSIKEASLKTGIEASNISKCASQKRRTAGGYVWGYAFG